MTSNIIHLRETQHKISYFWQLRKNVKESDLKIKNLLTQVNLLRNVSSKNWVITRFIFRKLHIISLLIQH